VLESGIKESEITKMNIYKARYLNALKKAAKVNRYLKKGYHVFFDGSPIKNGFCLKDNSISLKINDNFWFTFFINDKSLNNGYYTKISDWNKEFNEYIEVFVPQSKVVL
jgi:hypothetical protein